MKAVLSAATLALAIVTIPVAANAQSGAATGAATGAVTGAVVGGPVGDQRPKFRTYVTSQHPKSYTYNEKVVVGAKLPASGVTYHEVPKEYGVTKYRYTVVNDRPVLVDPGTHSIVQVIE